MLEHLPQKIIQSPFLAVIKTHLNTGLSDAVWSQSLFSFKQSFGREISHGPNNLDYPMTLYYNLLIFYYFVLLMTRPEIKNKNQQ